MSVFVSVWVSVWVYSVETLVMPSRKSSHLTFVGLGAILLGGLVVLGRLLGLQHLRVEQSSCHASQYRSSPVDPVIAPVVYGKGSAHSAGRIHAGSGIANGAQMAQGHTHADGQGSCEAWVGFVGIAGAEHGQHQHQAQEELNAQALQRADVRRQRGVTQSIVVVRVDEGLRGEEGLAEVPWRHTNLTFTAAVPAMAPRHWKIM